MTIPEAIKIIIKMYGIEILKSPERIQAMILDYVSGYEQEKQLFCMSCRMGLLIYAQELVSLKDEAEIREVAERAKKMLHSDAHISEEGAACIVNMLLKGLELTFNEDNYENDKLVEFPLDFTKECQFKATETRAENLKYHAINSDKELIGHLKKSANKENVSAYLKLGACYMHGIGTETDWMIAKYFYSKAIEYGNAAEQKEAKNRLIEIDNREQLWEDW